MGGGWLGSPALHLCWLWLGAGPISTGLDAHPEGPLDLVWPELQLEHHLLLPSGAAHMSNVLQHCFVRRKNLFAIYGGLLTLDR